MLSVEDVYVCFSEREALFLSDTLLSFMDCFEEDELPLAASVCRKLVSAALDRR